jgi:hypothetical protein
MTTSEGLRGAIAARQADPAPEPAAADLPELDAFGTPDAAELLRIVGLDPRNPLAHALVAVARRYGLDPLLGEIAIIRQSQRPYITRDGYLAIAHRSGKFDGMEVPAADPHREGSEWIARVAIWRKDMAHPFTFPGWGEMSDHGRDMAITRSERRGLKHAFNVRTPAGFAEDEYDVRVWEPSFGAGTSREQPAVSQGTAPAPGPGPARQQVAAIQAGFRDAGMGGRSGADRDRRMQLLSQWTGREITSTNDLTPAEADDAAAHLATLRGEHRDTSGAEPPGDSDPGGAGPGPEQGASLRDDAKSGEPPASGPGPVTRDQLSQLHALLGPAGIPGRDDALAAISEWTGRDINRTGQLTTAEYETVAANLRSLASITREEDGDAQ